MAKDELVDVVIGFRNGRELKVTVEQWDWDSESSSGPSWNGLDRRYGHRLETLDWDQVDYVLTTRHRGVS